MSQNSVVDIRKRIRKAASNFPDSLAEGFLASCSALVGLAIADNLQTISSVGAPYIYGIGTIIGIALALSKRRNWRWNRQFRRGVAQSSAWLSSTIAIIILTKSGENQLSVFDPRAGVSPYNFWVAVFLILGILLPTPLFMLADHFKRTQESLRSEVKSEKTTPQSSTHASK